MKQSFFLCGNKPTEAFHKYMRASLRHRQLRFGSGAFKTDAKDETDDDEEEKKALLVKVRNAAKEEIKNSEMFGFFTNMQEDWKKLPLEAVRALCDEKTGVLARFAALDAKMLEFETRAQAAGDKHLTLRGQIENWMTTNKDVLDQVKARKTGVSIPPMELDIRAVNSPMTPANTYIGTALPIPYYEPGINDIVRVQPTFWDYLTKGATNQPVYGWVNKTNVQGAAGFIGPGVLKPNVSFQLTTALSTYKKIAVTSKVTQELLWDVAGMETLIKDEIRYQILIALNTKLISNVGSATEPTGVRQLSVAFTKTGLKTTNANQYDALRAVVAQLRSGYLTGPITIFINPVDGANMDMNKAISSGVYLMPPFATASGKNIAGATIVEDYSIPAGYFQAGLFQYYRILIYKPLIMTFGWENDDFTKNLVTYLGEMALHQFFNTQYTGAFVYDSFANVMSLLNTGTMLAAEGFKDKDGNNIISDSDDEGVNPSSGTQR